MKKMTIFLFSLLFSFSANSLFAEEPVKREFSKGELEQMLAPIALYPDSVLTHILIASTYPLEIIQANRWASKNSELEPGEALEKVENRDWDPSVKALIPFPRVLEKLSDDLEWTQKLGDAFLQDEKAVLEAIQSLRWRADQAGNLDKMERMEVSREDDKIIIQPVEKEVVYVPYYDTRVVYGPWYWHHYPPVYWDWHWGSHHHYGHHGLYRWHPRVHISFNYFFSAFHWHNHHVVVINHHSHHSRRYHHRRHIIRDSNARRWHHNPAHRRGVAYRTEHIRERYHSNRPSISQTRVTRRNERALVSDRRVNGDNRSNRSVSASRNNRDNRTLSSNSTRPQVTRQEQLRQRLNTHGGRRNDGRVERGNDRRVQPSSSRSDTINRATGNSRTGRTNRDAAANNRRNVNSQRNNVERSNTRRNDAQRSNVHRSQEQRSREQRSDSVTRNLNPQRNNTPTNNRANRSNVQRETSSTRQNQRSQRRDSASGNNLNRAVDSNRNSRSTRASAPPRPAQRQSSSYTPPKSNYQPPKSNYQPPKSNYQPPKSNNRASRSNHQSSKNRSSSSYNRSDSSRRQNSNRASRRRDH